MSIKPNPKRPTKRTEPTPPPEAAGTIGTAARVAREAGVSVYTVSRAFSGAAGVSNETRRRVFEAARMLDYRTGRASQELVRQRVGRVAAVRTLGIMRAKIYQEMLAGLENQLAENRIELLLPGPADAEDLAGWLRALRQNAAPDALAVCVDDFNAQTIDMLHSFGVPVVLMHYSSTLESPPPVSTVCYDTPDGIRQAVRHLALLGHRAIAYFNIMPVHAEHIRREQGFRAAMAEAGLPVNERWVVQATSTSRLAPGAAAIDYVFSRSTHCPTAIVCAVDIIALGALSGARRWGKNIPTDLSITGFDDYFWLDYYTPAVTTVRQSGWEMGEAAARVLATHIADPAAIPEHVVLPTQLIVRESTAPARVGPNHSLEKEPQ